MFLIAGEALYDLFAEPRDAGAFAFDARPGGSPLNVAFGLARLGCEAAFLGGVSRDFLGEALVRLMEREGVSTQALIRNDGPTTLSLVGRNASGAPSYSFRGDGAADRIVRAATDLPDGARALHLGSYSTVVEPFGGSLTALARRAAGRLFVSYDPNARPGVEPDMETWRRRFFELLPCVDLLKASAEDLDLLFPGADEAGLAGDWLAQGPRLVVVTHGERGATAYGAGGRVEAPAPLVEVADTVGAGDSFMAALLCRLDHAGALSRDGLAGLAPAATRRLLEDAAAAAAVTCSRRGANPPRRGELPGWD